METKRCSKCGLVKPITEFHRNRKAQDGHFAACKSCENAASSARYFKNREKVIERTARYNREHPELRREIDQRFREKHHDRRLETYRKYNQSHAEQRRAYRRTDKSRQAVRRCQQAKPEQYRAAAREWERRNPDLLVAKRHRRRAQKLANGGSFKKQEWMELKEKYDFRCLCCGRAEPDILLTPDHVIPIVHGGSNDISNIQPLCGSCNSKKHMKHTDYR